MRIVFAISSVDRARAEALEDQCAEHDARVHSPFSRLLIATDPREIDAFAEELRRAVHERAAHLALVHLFLLECPGGLDAMLRRRKVKQAQARVLADHAGVFQALADAGD